jgi:hypothetical protein
VVVGVFIGIQVANWNEERYVAKTEKVILQRLADEMKVIDIEFRVDLVGYSQTQKATGELIDALRHGQEPTDKVKFKEILSQANYYYYIPSLSAIYSEMVATGALKNISNNELRSALQRYGDIHQRYMSTYANALNTLLKPDSNYFKAVEWSTNPNEWVDAETAIVAYNWDILIGSKAELQSWLSYQADGLDHIEAMHKEIVLINELLNKENKK